MAAAAVKKTRAEHQPMTNRIKVKALPKEPANDDNPVFIYHPPSMTAEEKVIYDNYLRCRSEDGWVPFEKDVLLRIVRLQMAMLEYESIGVFDEEYRQLNTMFVTLSSRLLLLSSTNDAVRKAITQAQHRQNTEDMTRAAIGGNFDNARLLG